MAQVRVAHSIYHGQRRSMKTIAVIGGGLMGSGIAQVSLQSGYAVHLVDKDAEAVDKCSAVVKRNLIRIGEKQFAQNSDEAKRLSDSCISNFTASSDLKKAASQAYLVIEAIVERLEAKHELFCQLEQYAPSECCFASNTSSLSLRQIGSAMKRRDRFGGLHFFNPVPVLKLVEVIRTAETSQGTFEHLMQFARSLGKHPVVCRDTPGFIVNRLLVPYLIEAIRLIERGEVSPVDVDAGMKLGAGYPMGPFELADFVGLDTVKFICDSFAVQLPDHPNLVCPAMLAQLVADGKLGRKSGRGFYNYDEHGNKVG